MMWAVLASGQHRVLQDPLAMACWRNVSYSSSLQHYGNRLSNLDLGHGCEEDYDTLTTAVEDNADAHPQLLLYHSWLQTMSRVRQFYETSTWFDVYDLEIHSFSHF